MVTTPAQAAAADGIPPPRLESWGSGTGGVLVPYNTTPAGHRYARPLGHYRSIAFLRSASVQARYAMMASQ